jgi:hypothetical protein
MRFQHHNTTANDSAATPLQDRSNASKPIEAAAAAHRLEAAAEEALQQQQQH